MSFVVCNTSVNPIAVATAFKELIESEFPSFRDCGPNNTEKQIADLLFEKFSEITTSYNLVEDCEITFASEADQPSSNEFLGQDPSLEESTGNVDQSSEKSTGNVDQSSEKSTGNVDQSSEKSTGNVDQSSEESTGNVDQSSQESVVCSQDFMQPRGYVPIKKKAKILKQISEQPNCSFNYWNKRFPSLKHPSYKNRWKKHVQGGGTKREISYEVNLHTFKRFKEARSIFKAVHDSDLRRWAMQRAVDLPNFRKYFVASKQWVNKFKKVHRISSRKVQRLVSKREIASEKQILETCEEFRNEILALGKNYALENILNTDQIGFTEEYASQRTLSFTCERYTFGSAFSPKNKMTHSYTSQLIISAAGEIIGDVLVCLQEPNGVMGEYVQNNVFLAPNVCYTCSKSGKLSTGHVKYFIEKVLEPETRGKGKVLYILDSWGGQKDEKLYEGLNRDEDKIQLKVIPPHCTPYVQPLDVYFNLQLKYLVKKIYAYANLNDINITTRDDIIKIQSIAHFTLKAPKFKPMIAYCFKKAGLVSTEREYFENVKDACFNLGSACCSKLDCEKLSFIRCSWCDCLLCFEHLYIDFHVYNCAKGPYFMPE